MKHAFILFCLPFSFFFGYGQGIEFETGDWHSVLLKAKQENKYIFVDCYTVWCKPCKWMDANVFPLQSVGDFFNDKFISLKMDMEKGEGVDIGKKYDINSYPTYLFLDSEGNLIHREGGLNQVKDFIGLGKKALSQENNLAAMNEAYQAGNQSRDFLRTYIITLGRAKEKVKQKEVFESYFNSVPKDELINEKDFDVIASVAKTGDETFLFLLNNHEKYEKVIDKRKVDSRIYATLILPFSLMVYKNNVELMKKEAEKYKPYYPSIVQKAEDMAMIRWYRTQKLTEPLSKACIAYIKKYSQDGPDDIYYCMNMILNAPEMESKKYNDVLRITGNAVKKFPNSYNLNDVYAGLLYKSGRTEEARDEAKKVIGISPKEKQPNLWSWKFLQTPNSI